jgi:hypothetical protein
MCKIKFNETCPTCGHKPVEITIDEIGIEVRYDENFYPDYLKSEYDEENKKIINSARYSNSDVDSEGWDQVKKWIDEDHKRLEDFENNKWDANGVIATARVKYPIGGNNWRLEWLSSGGLWGVESDCGDDYMQEVVDGELERLKQHLEKFGVNTSDFEKHAKKAKEKIKEKYIWTIK